MGRSNPVIPGQVRGVKTMTMRRMKLLDIYIGQWETTTIEDERYRMIMNWLWTDSGCVPEKRCLKKSSMVCFVFCQVQYWSLVQDRASQGASPWCSQQQEVKVKSWPHAFFFARNTPCAIKVGKSLPFWFGRLFCNPFFWSLFPFSSKNSYSSPNFQLHSPRCWSTASRWPRGPTWGREMSCKLAMGICRPAQIVTQKDLGLFEGQHKGDFLRIWVWLLGIHNIMDIVVVILNVMLYKGFLCCSWELL